MYKLSVKSEFSAAHNLRGYKGKCEDLHGHNWKVEAAAVSEELNKQGMALDFHEIKKLLNETLEEMDHKYLNELKHFKEVNPARNTKSIKRKSKISNGVNPTSENLARYIFDKLDKALANTACRLQEVTVWESDSCSATYSK